MRCWFLPFLLSSVWLSGCDLIEPPPTPQVAVVSSGGEVRVLAGDDSAVEIAWTGDVSPSNSASLQVAGDRLFVASALGLSEFGMSDGLSRWPRIELPSDILNLAHSGTDRVFAIGFNELTGVDAQLGGVLWSRSLLDDLSGVSDSAIAASPDALALGGEPTRLLDTESGIVLSEAAFDAGAVSAIAYTDDALLVGNALGIQALDRGSLGAVWVSATAAPVDRFVVAGAGLLLSSLGEGLTLLDPANGQVLAVAEPGEVFRAVAAAGDLFFAVRSDGILLALDSSLDEVWRIEATPDFGGLSVSGGNVYYATGSGLEALSAAAGDYLWGRDFEGSVIGLLAL
jgi:outer membrane protein assembly factor BamB